MGVIICLKKKMQATSYWCMATDSGLETLRWDRADAIFHFLLSLGRNEEPCRELFQQLFLKLAQRRFHLR